MDLKLKKTSPNTIFASQVSDSLFSSDEKNELDSCEEEAKIHVIYIYK